MNGPARSVAFDRNDVRDLGASKGGSSSGGAGMTTSWRLPLVPSMMVIVLMAGGVSILAGSGFGTSAAACFATRSESGH
jgi:hypothetical protein